MLAIIDGKVLLLFVALIAALAFAARLVYVAARREAGWPHRLEFRCDDCGATAFVWAATRADYYDALAHPPTCTHQAPAA